MTYYHDIEYDDSEAVADRIGELTNAELRELCETYRAKCAQLGHRPYGYRFGAWLRDRIATELREEAYASDDA